ncbi:translation initiation factor eIF-3b like protein [Cichlidogyrus casuarinus]|uniref:Eukaryotic translation initiation factor 3 subunit B n=1 Tax=Cichlidogyrus casuarinus TaxID=1844966 RepID=A0ABD2Q8V4_9PLAT
MPTNISLSLCKEELIPDLLKEEPKPAVLYENTIIVDGCPKVKQEKFEKLLQVLLSKFSKFGKIINQSMPTYDQETIGCIFITYELRKSALAATKDMNAVAFDKNHTFLVTLLSSYEKIVHGSDSSEKSKNESYKDPGNLRWWLQNELCRDQFSLVYVSSPGKPLTGSVQWFSSVEPVMIKEHESWTNRWMIWSPKGSYMVTKHEPGVILWAGEEFIRVSRLAHPSVGFADFSPNEKFLVTYSKSQSASSNVPLGTPGILADIIVWNIEKGQMMHEFTMHYGDQPVFRWSHNDGFAACLVNGVIYIYETNKFTLIDRKISVSENKISSFAWSPTEDIIAYWVPEKDSTPARCVIVNVNNWQEISTKNLFSVAKIQLHWQDQGEYLAVEVLRCAKKKQQEKQIKFVGTFVNFEILRLREKGYPWDKLEIKDCDLTSFQWEPNGHRFSFVTLQPSTQKTAISIFQMMKSGKIKSCAVMERSNAKISDLKWSPKGGILVVASCNSADSYLEFIDANECHSLAKQEHAMLSEFHWDPTGRYVASCVLSANKNDNAVWFWGCIGTQLHKMSYKELHSFSWRPRPPTLLSQEQISTVKKNLHTYVPHLENEDKMLASKANRELLEKRQKLSNNFNKWRLALRERFEREKPGREKLRGQ